MNKFFEIVKDIFIVMLLVYIFLIVLSVIVHSHSFYHEHCCNEKDCAPVDKIEKHIDGDLFISKHGKVLIKPDSNIVRYPSPDDKFHICMIKYEFGTHATCIYSPALYWKIGNFNKMNAANNAENEDRQRNEIIPFYYGKKSYFDMVKEFHKSFNLSCPDKIVHMNNDLFILRENLIEEELVELSNEMIKYGTDRFDISKAVKETADLIYVLIGMMVCMGIPFDECFHEVHRSNMSKLDDKGNPIYREDGKVLKSSRYTPANLKKILEKYK